MQHTNRQHLSVAREGNTVTRHGPTTVLPKCDENQGHWFCATHREDFANQLQKDIHIHDGKHTLAWVCHTHGVEVP
jgi:hypothetical protein